MREAQEAGAVWMRLRLEGWGSGLEECVVPVKIIIVGGTEKPRANSDVWTGRQTRVIGQKNAEFKFWIGLEAWALGDH